MALDVLAYVLAGGKGTRLAPLTRDRGKPAVPIGSIHRVIDFPLSNLYNSAIRKVAVLTQYEFFSTHEHIKHGWDRRFGIGRKEFITTVSAMQREKEDGWFEGTADAVMKNDRFIQENKELDLVNIIGGDHIYFMDYSQMNDFHMDNSADLTISAIPVKRELAAGNYGVLVVDKKGQLIGWEEKPENPTPMPGNEEYCLASMGNYAFNPKQLLVEFAIDRNKEQAISKEQVLENPNKYTSHDFGFDIIPSMLREEKRIFVYNLHDNIIPGMTEEERGYWRDIGTLDQTFQANMEIRDTESPINMYNDEWEPFTHIESHRHSKIISTANNRGSLINSTIAPGVIISGADINCSVLGYETRINEKSFLDHAVMLGYTQVGKNVKIKNAIVDRKVIIPDGETIGYDLEKDLARGFTISEGGITVVPRNYKF
jgi:glucose-1-phosphate adenylyltransferase